MSVESGVSANVRKYVVQFPMVSSIKYNFNVCTLAVLNYCGKHCTVFVLVLHGIFQKGSAILCYHSSIYCNVLNDLYKTEMTYCIYAK